MQFFIKRYVFCFRLREACGGHAECCGPPTLPPSETTTLRGHAAVEYGEPTVLVAGRLSVLGMHPTLSEWERPDYN